MENDFSQLTHENVVRYYDAWIETIPAAEEPGEISIALFIFFLSLFFFPFSLSLFISSLSHFLLSSLYIHSLSLIIHINMSVAETKSPAKKVPASSMDAILAKLAPGVKLEWSISEAPVQKGHASSDSEEEVDDDDEDDGWFKML